MQKAAETEKPERISIDRVETRISRGWRSKFYSVHRKIQDGTEIPRKESGNGICIQHTGNLHTIPGS